MKPNWHVTLTCGRMLRLVDDRVAALMPTNLDKINAKFTIMLDAYRMYFIMAVDVVV